MDIYQIVINSETDFDSAINSLNDEITALEKKQREPTDLITADRTGYFISYTDGFENKLSPETIDNLTVGDIKDIISSSKIGNSNSTVGKIVDGYEWKIILIFII